MKVKRTRVPLTFEEKQEIMDAYLFTSSKVLDIASHFNIDRRTLYRVIHKFHYPVRLPSAGNRSNHPSRKEGEQV